MKLDLRALNARHPASFSDAQLREMDMSTTYYDNLYEMSAYGVKKDVDVRKIVGTTHSSNAGKWGDLLKYGTDRIAGSTKMDDCLKGLQRCPYDLFATPQEDIKLIEVDGQYYQDGEGIHRIVVAKFLAEFNADELPNPTLKGVRVTSYARHNEVFNAYHALREVISRRSHLSMKLLPRSRDCVKYLNGEAEPHPNRQSVTAIRLTNHLLPKRNDTLDIEETAFKDLLDSLEQTRSWRQLFSKKARFLTDNRWWAMPPNLNPWSNTGDYGRMGSFPSL